MVGRDYLKIQEIKPSKRIMFRKLTLNLRVIAALSIFVLQFVDEFISAFTNQNTIYGFIIALAQSTDVVVIIITVLLLLAFFYLVMLLLTNVGAIVWGYLNYLTMFNYLDEKVVRIKKGVIFKQEFEIPIHKLTNVYTNISILDRILGTADLHCSTAGGADIYILETLSQDKAMEIRQFLLTQIGALDERLETRSGDFLEDPRIQQELREIRKLIAEAFAYPSL